jgi:hypothetical protein
MSPSKKLSINRRTIKIGLLVAALVVLFNPVPGPAENMISELQAEFIGRFPQFIEWPANSSVSDSSAPFVIGVYGDSEVLAALERITGKTKILGKQVEARKITSISSVDSCQIVFVAKSQREQLSAILGQTRGKPILTVGDTAGFGRQGVIINFTVEGSSLKFEINQSAADANGLRLAPKLLALGKVI